ncbi:MAG: SGNH/GDSL hydrolase family protein, partial [Phycisphaeraceae bacterium]
LGDPPLSIADPEIEYLFKPSQDVSRFGNRIKYNAYSMRADDFSLEKTNEQELRVLVLGDSVANGGSQTDQSELATQLVQARLSEQLGRPVIVGNISAGSWGPGNVLAYVKRHGLFDADVVALVISSHDASDVPDFKPIVDVSPDFPGTKPALALEELIFRYLPRYLPGKAKPVESDAEELQPKEFTAIEDLEKLIQLIQEADVPMIILQHASRDELADGYDPGHGAIAKVAESAKVPTVELGPSFEAAINAGKNVYRDNIHPNAQGQAVLAEALEEAILETLEQE